MGVPILVVGASARHLVFSLPQGIPPHRATKDWDFGILVPSWEGFRRFRDALLHTNDFDLDPLREPRLKHKAAGMQVDLVPFGGLESEGRIQWPQSQSEMDVIAFSDAYEHCIEVQVDERVRLRVATTPLLVALKLLAFADRKDDTDRDIKDLWHFMEHYIDTGQTARLWEEPIASAIADEFAWTAASAFMLGYDLACACRPETVKRLTPVIAQLIDPYSRYIGPLIGYSASQQGEEARRQHISKSFLWLRKGIELATQRRAAHPTG